MARAPHHERTKAAYDADATGWRDRTEARRPEWAAELASIVAAHPDGPGPVADLGCGPGWHLPALGDHAIGLDLSLPMLQMAHAHGSVAQGDLAALPIASGSLAGAWASRSYVHFGRRELPMALAELHRVLRVGGVARLWLFEGDHDQVAWPDDSLPGRTFSYWDFDHLERVVIGAGFEIEHVERWQSEHGLGQIMLTLTRAWTLPDYVAPGMRLLVCGLNPSPGSADSGVGFFRAGNRFWPAAMHAGLVTADRDPRRALAEHGVGMTDLVKRTTRRADELDPGEYRAGVERLRRLVDWLEPAAVCMVGLAGWRAAVDRSAARGWQPELLGSTPIYLMPSTSGLNAHDTIDSLCEHMKVAAGARP